MNFLPAKKYPNGGTFSLRLIQDADNFLKFKEAMDTVLPAYLSGQTAKSWPMCRFKAAMYMCQMTPFWNKFLA